MCYILTQSRLEQHPKYKVARGACHSKRGVNWFRVRRCVPAACHKSSGQGAIVGSGNSIRLTIQGHKQLNISYNSNKNSEYHHQYQVMNQSSMIKANEYVILRINQDRYLYALLEDDRSTARIFNKTVSLGSLLGQPYGQQYNIINGSLQPITSNAALGPDAPQTISRSNKNLVGSAANQALDKSSISHLKQSGVTGSDIVQALVAGSSTYQNKTEYSQAKYSKKKQQKHNQTITVLKACTRSISQMSWSNHTFALFNLRPDSLSLMLAQANIGAHAKVLVMDQTMGLVTGAVVERLGGFGNVVVCTPSNTWHTQVTQPTLRLFNLSQQQKDNMGWVPLQALIQCRKGLSHDDYMQKYGFRSKRDRSVDQDKVVGSEGTANVKKSKTIQQDKTQSVVTNTVYVNQCEIEDTTVRKDERLGIEQQELENLQGQNGKEEKRCGQNIQQNYIKESAGGQCHQAREKDPTQLQEVKVTGKVKGKGKQYQGQINRLTWDQVSECCNYKFDSCILACPSGDYIQLIQHILPLLEPSAPFVCYSSSLLGLCELQEYLLSTQYATSVQVQESTLRHYQVLPGRTRPDMSGSGCGGYVLWGVKVSDTVSKSYKK